jgi:hypothetical protein
MALPPSFFYGRWECNLPAILDFIARHFFIKIDEERFLALQAARNHVAHACLAF